jgi:hypothetical protein
MGYFMFSFVCTFTASVHPPHHQNANVSLEETCENIGQKNAALIHCHGHGERYGTPAAFDPHTFLAKKRAPDARSWPVKRSARSLRRARRLTRSSISRTGRSSAPSSPSTARKGKRGW